MISQGKRSINATSPFCKPLSLLSFFFLFTSFVCVFLLPPYPISEKISLALHAMFYIIYLPLWPFIFRDYSGCPWRKEQDFYITQIILYQFPTLTQLPRPRWSGGSRMRTGKDTPLTKTIILSIQLLGMHQCLNPLDILWE